MPHKGIQQATNMSFVLQLQAVIQNCLEARCLKRTVYCRVDLAKIAMMDCGFELIRIFQREL